MKITSVSYLVMASIIALVSCTPNTETDTTDKDLTETAIKGQYELTKTQFESSDMKLGKFETKTFHEVVKATGMFDVPPGNKASVNSYFGGTVKDIELLPGESVKKGQVLFTIENPEFLQIQQDFLEAKGQLKYLKSDYERQKNLAQDNVASQKSYLKAESDYIVTSVKVESLKKKLLLMQINPNELTLENIQTTVNITSPINGYITQIDINKGTFLNPSQAAIKIVDTDHLHLELNIFEKDLPKISIGQPIQFSIQEDKSKQYEATVHLVNKTVDQESRTIGIHGHLTDEELSHKFTPGMYVEANIYATSELKTSLPEDALIEVEGRYYALVLQDSTKNGYTLVKKEFKIGDSGNGYLSILNYKDFDESTQFLTKGAFNLITE